MNQKNIDIVLFNRNIFKIKEKLRLRIYSHVPATIFSLAILQHNPLGFR